MTFHSTLHNQAIDAAILLPAVSARAPIDETLLERFNDHFETAEADTPSEIELAQKIRYQVYCIEHPHESADNPHGVETDQFDCHAVHALLIHSAENRALGTVRLILPLADNLKHSFAVQEVMDEFSLAEFNRLPLHLAGEVSRFCISRAFRRRAGDTRYGQPENETTTPGTSEERRNGPLMRLGLIQALLRMSIENGVTYWVAAMEPTLLRMLAAMGIRFTPVGPLIEYHGLRQPCYCYIPEVLETVRNERPAFWSVITDGGRLAW